MEYRLEQLEYDVYSHIHQCAHTSEELLKLMELISIRTLEFKSSQNYILSTVKNCVNDLSVLKQSSTAFQIVSLNLVSKLSLLEDQLGEISAPLSSAFSHKNVILAFAKSIGAVCSKIKVSPINCDSP